MQLIPLKQLKQLASSQKTVSEADATQALYDEFKREYKKTYDFFAKSDATLPAEATFQILLEGWIKEHCPPIELIGKGSSRYAFACGGGKCLKVAYNDAGINQNKAEYENTALPKSLGYAIFARTFDRADDNSSLLTECCSKLTIQEWAKMWRLSGTTFEKAPESYILVIADALHNSKWNPKKAIENLEKPQAEFVERIQIAEDPAMKTLASLFQFYAADESNWEKLMPFDLCTEENWGAAIRFGETVPVILDAGFSSNTFDIEKLMAL